MHVAARIRRRDNAMVIFLRKMKTYFAARCGKWMDKVVEKLPSMFSSIVSNQTLSKYLQK